MCVFINLAFSDQYKRIAIMGLSWGIEMYLTEIKILLFKL